MATLRLSKESQKSLLDFAITIKDWHVNNRAELVNKMDLIDQAYARYKETSDQNTDGGVDVVAANTACDVFDTKDRVTPPIVVSQVDAYVAYLADVFLSGTPMFPVVSTKKNKVWAEQLETLMDDHASLSGYARQLLMFFRDAIKYNIGAVELDWDVMDHFSPITDYLNGQGQKLSKTDKFYNKIKRLPIRNTIIDKSVLPGDVAKDGDFAGYIEEMSMVQMKRLVQKLQKQNRVFNVTEAMDSGRVRGTHDGTMNVVPDPQISNYVTRQGYRNTRGIDWDAYAAGATDSTKRKSPSYGKIYERIVLYVRIIPRDHGIVAPEPGTPQIWRLMVINNQHLISAHRVVTAFNHLPILVGQPIEDGFAEQTQSVAEGEMPFQQAAETLFNIRFSAARRAVSDRALYNSNILDPKHVNSKAAAAKIPVNINPLTQVSLESIYMQIPFDMRGTETTISDAQQIVQFSKELHGLNGPKMGQFQKGNKSVQEWDDTMAGSDNRLRLPALTLEIQIFSPMKSMMVLNIFMFGEDVQLISQKTGDVVQIDIKQLREQVLSFKIADGYTPKSKLASTEMLASGLQIIGSSQILQQAYGPSLPGMFAHLMSLGGVKGLEEYSPQVPQGAAVPGLSAASLQQPPVQAPASDPTQPPTELP